MERLYIEERLSLDAVGKIFGMSRQAVHYRFNRAGIERRRYTEPVDTKLERARRECDVAELVRQYEVEMKSVLELSRVNRISYDLMLTILRREGVTIRPPGWQTKRKYPEIYALKIGESVLLDVSQLKAPYSTVAGVAYRMNARLSVKRVEGSSFRIKRLT